MLGLFLKLGPIAAGLLGGVGSIAVVGAGFWLWNTFVDNPGIVREQRAICVSEVEKAAAIATREEQRRQFDIAERATQRALEEEAEQRARHESDIGKLTERIKTYEAQRLGEGRACPLTSDDIDFLNGVLDD